MNERLRRMLKLHGLYQEEHNDGTGGKSTGGASGDSGAGDGDKGGTGGSADDGKGKAGKSGLDDTAAELLREVMDKKAKLKAMNEQLEQVNARLAAFEGLDPEKARALVQAEAERQRKELEEKGQWETLKQQMADAHAAEKTALEAKIAELSGKVEESTRGASAKIAELTVGNAFGTSKFIAENLILPVSKARVLFGSHFEYDGERVVGYDKPAGAADRKPLVDAQGQALPFDVALQKLVEADPDKDTMLKSKARPGAGSGTADGAAQVVEKSDLKGVDRLAAALAARRGQK